mmetsp:Transcript_21305/g.37290  ORF Transcript_21305/g.37290 Transcript_21305/m.37290 type:complete len:427 (-) Transcript_21305:287-1567(-)
MLFAVVMSFSLSYQLLQRTIRPSTAVLFCGISSFGAFYEVGAFFVPHSKFQGFSLLQKKSFSSFTMSMQKHRVVTYNVLSSRLAGEDHFTHCKPEDLDARNRLPRIIEKLEKEVRQDSIICLQEVSYDWAGKLATYFQQNDYFFFTGLYGKPFNGYMGVAMAFPNKKYEAQEMKVMRLSDTKKWPRKPEPGLVGKISEWLWSTLRKPYHLLTGARAPPCPWALARGRFNAILLARLRARARGPSGDRGALLVGTYHMPCMFRNPEVMTLHAALAAQHMQFNARGAPYVLAGDFNFTPGSPQYELMTKGALAQGHPEVPPPLPWDDTAWAPRCAPMRSAYAAHLGREPAYTNNAQIKDDAPFIETLDYLFHSPSLKVQGVISLDYLEELKDRPFPIKSEPSDHVMIGAEFQQKTDEEINSEKWAGIH